MSTGRSTPDKQTQQWLTRFSGIKSETVFKVGTGRARYILWNDIQSGEGTTEWIKLDRSALEHVRR